MTKEHRRELFWLKAQILIAVAQLSLILAYIALAVTLGEDIWP